MHDNVITMAINGDAPVRYKKPYLFLHQPFESELLRCQLFLSARYLSGELVVPECGCLWFVGKRSVERPQVLVGA